MLVLSRQRDETIMIGDDIEITIVDIRGDKVRLGITAPATIPVHRKEVYEAIQRENREAARVKMEDLPNMPPPAKGTVKPGNIPPGLHRHSQRPGPHQPGAPRPGPQNPGANPGATNPTGANQGLANQSPPSSPGATDGTPPAPKTPGNTPPGQ
jgi:carbon storage regulator